MCVCSVTQSCIHICTCVWMYVCVCIFLFVCMQVCVCNVCVYVCAYVMMYMLVVNVCICLFMCTQILSTLNVFNWSIFVILYQSIWSLQSVTILSKYVRNLSLPLSSDLSVDALLFALMGITSLNALHPQMRSQLHHLVDCIPIQMMRQRFQTLFKLTFAFLIDIVQISLRCFYVKMNIFSVIRMLSLIRILIQWKLYIMYLQPPFLLNIYKADMKDEFMEGGKMMQEYIS